MGRLTDLRWMCGIALVALLASAGCGGNSNGGEFVWLQVVNGYPGSQSASVYGPSGTIASNLEFGQRTDEFIRVNRNLGTEIQIVLEALRSRSPPKRIYSRCIRRNPPRFSFIGEAAQTRSTSTSFDIFSRRLQTPLPFEPATATTRAARSSPTDSLPKAAVSPTGRWSQEWEFNQPARDTHDSSTPTMPATPKSGGLN